MFRKHNHAITDIRNDTGNDQQYKDMTAHLFQHRSVVAGGIVPGQYQLGTTKVFLRAGVLHSLNSIQEKMQERSCVKIQRLVRTCQAWKLHQRQKAAVSGVQRLWRGCLGASSLFFSLFCCCFVTVSSLLHHCFITGHCFIIWSLFHHLVANTVVSFHRLRGTQKTDSTVVVHVWGALLFPPPFPHHL